MQNEKEMENMIVVKDTEYLERCWQAETWKDLASVITSYTWIASDGNLVSMKRKITRTKRYLKNRILTESKTRKLTGEKFKKREIQEIFTLAERPGSNGKENRS